jgi:SAM-dependent methyltransferase
MWFKKNLRYVHTYEKHSDVVPSVIVPILIEIFKPKSIIDYGCGTGNFLAAFKKKMNSNVCGIDGTWVNKELLFKNIKANEFVEYNLEQLYVTDKRYDLAISLEVAEHIDETYSDNFVKSLCNLSDIVVFSAAIPQQGGENHVNEQWPAYWQRKFSKNNFEAFDLLRPILWDSDQLDSECWYKQNIIVYAKRGALLEDVKERARQRFPAKVMPLVHPKAYIALKNREALLRRIGLTQSINLIENYLKHKKCYKAVKHLLRFTEYTD